jgi:hypothetical protein
VAAAFYRSPRISATAKLLTTAGIVLALFGGLVIYPEEAAFRKALRARAACVVERGASYGDNLAHSEVIAVQLAVYLPGQFRPAWTGTVTTHSPQRISGLNKNKGAVGNQEVVTEKTVGELKDSLKSAFRYW